MLFCVVGLCPRLPPPFFPALDEGFFFFRRIAKEGDQLSSVCGEDLEFFFLVVLFFLELAGLGLQGGEDLQLFGGSQVAHVAVLLLIGKLLPPDAGGHAPEGEVDGVGIELAEASADLGLGVA